MNRDTGDATVPFSLGVDRAKLSAGSSNNNNNNLTQTSQNTNKNNNNDNNNADYDDDDETASQLNLPEDEFGEYSTLDAEDDEFGAVYGGGQETARKQAYQVLTQMLSVYGSHCYSPLRAIIGAMNVCERRMWGFRGFLTFVFVLGGVMCCGWSQYWCYYCC